MPDQWDEFQRVESGGGGVATAPEADPWAEFKAVPTTPPLAAGETGAPNQIAGSGAVFGRNMNGSVDTTDVGRMSDFNAHHGAWNGVDLRDPDLIGMAIGGQQAVALTGISDPAKAQAALLGKTVNVFNRSTGRTNPVQIVDKAPRGQPFIEMTPAAHRLVGSDGSSHELVVRLADGETFAAPPAMSEPGDKSLASAAWLDNPVARNAALAVGDTIKGFIPTSPGQVLALLTPAAGAVEEVKKTYGMVHDMIGGKSLPDALLANKPEVAQLEDAMKTPPYSRERFAAGFNVLAQFGMLAAGVHGLEAKPKPSQAARPAEAAPAGTDFGLADVVVPVPERPLPFQNPLPTEVPAGAEFQYGRGLDPFDVFARVQPAGGDINARIQTQPQTDPAGSPQGGGADVQANLGPAQGAEAPARPAGESLPQPGGGEGPAVQGQGEIAAPRQPEPLTFQPFADLPDLVVKPEEAAGGTAAVPSESLPITTRIAGAEFTGSTAADALESARATLAPEMSPAEFIKIGMETEQDFGIGLDSKQIEAYANTNVTAAPHEAAIPGESPQQGQAFAPQPDNTLPPAPSAPAIPRRGRRLPPDDFATEVTPVSSFIINDVGGLMSRSTAKRKGLLERNADLWDGAPELKHPTHNKIYQPGGGETPDTVAQALYDEGLIREPTPDAMWQAIDGESRSARSLAAQARAAAAEATRLKLRANKEGGFVNADLLQGAADFGRKIYQSGMDFARWSGEMLRHLGDKIRPHLTNLWRSLTGQDILPHASERGGARLGPSQADIEGAGNTPEKMREHIRTVQRMTEVSPDVKERVESWYSPVTLPEINERARGVIDQHGLGKATDVFMRSKAATPDMLALGHHVALRLDALERFDESAMVRDAMAERLTTPAQSLWYVSTISKTSPEGLIREAQKVVSEAIKADPEKQKLVAEIQRLQTQLTALKDGPQKTAAINLVLKQLGKVNRPGQKLTAARVNDLVKRNEAGLLTPQQLADALAKHLHIPRVDAATVAKIKVAQVEYARAEASGDPILRLRRGMDMMDAVYSLTPRSMWDKVRATAVISMILHGKLPVRIGLSNSIRMVGQFAVDTIENIPRDIGNVWRGNRTITADQFHAIDVGLEEPLTAFRAGFADAKARGLATVPSFREGVRTVLDMASMTTRGMFDIENFNGRGSHIFSSRFGRLAEDTVTLIHNVIPYAFWNAGFKSSLVRQMRIAGVEVPTAEMIGSARIDGNRAIFQNETVGYEMLKKLRNLLDFPTGKIIPSSKGKYGFGTATIPFAKVPTALLAEGATWSPLGFIKAGWEGIGRPLTKQEFRPKEVADAMIKAAIGTGSTVLTGYWLAKLGVLTGAPDEDKALNAMQQSLGWGKYKINLSELKRRFLSGNFHSQSVLPQDGDMIINYSWAEPVAFPLAFGADLAHSQEHRVRELRKGRIVGSEWVSATKAGLESLLDNPLVQGLQQLAANLGERQYGRLLTDIIGNVPGNFVPSLVRQTGQAIDNTVRETRAGGPVQSEIARLEVQLPWLSKKYPPRYDVFGEAVQRQNYGKVSLINTFFNPAQVSHFKSNPEVAELMKLYTATGSSDIIPKNVDSSLTITKLNGDKQQIQLDNQQLATYQRYVGQLSAGMITRLMASPVWAAEPAAVRQNTITQVLGAVHRSAKIDLFGDRPFGVSAGTLTSKPELRLPSAVDLISRVQGRQLNLNEPVAPGANQ